MAGKEGILRKQASGRWVGCPPGRQPVEIKSGKLQRDECHHTGRTRQYLRGDQALPGCHRSATVAPAIVGKRRARSPPFFPNIRGRRLPALHCRHDP